MLKEKIKQFFISLLFMDMKTQARRVQFLAVIVMGILLVCVFFLSQYEIELTAPKGTGRDVIGRTTLLELLLPKKNN